jgi:hypothetical protein
MNMQVGRQTLSEPELQRMVLSYLRMLPACQHIAAVEIAPRHGSQRNWILLGTEPPLSTAADNEARNALVELQREFALLDAHA